MKQIWNWIKNNPNRAMFLVPILLVAGISISHVVTWYDMANPFNWAIYLSIAIEVGAMTALVAATNKIKGGVWFMFAIVTLIQMIGNIFYSYNQIDQNGDLFKSWVELTYPLWEVLGTESTDLVGLKRWLSFLEGGLLPLISLTSLHFFVKYDRENEIKSAKIEQVTEQVVEETKEEIQTPKQNFSTTPKQNFSAEIETKIEEIITLPENNIENIIIDEKPIEENVILDENLPSETTITEEIIVNVTDNASEETGVLDLPQEPLPIQQDVVIPQDNFINNITPKKKMGIDRIR